jgi:hypothetical protein
MTFREDWTDEMTEDLTDGEVVDIGGNWTFYIAEDGKYEATEYGLYMYIYDDLDDMLDRAGDEDVYEYDGELSDGVEGDHFMNDSGEVRVG